MYNNNVEKNDDEFKNRDDNNYLNNSNNERIEKSIASFDVQENSNPDSLNSNLMHSTDINNTIQESSDILNRSIIDADNTEGLSEQELFDLEMKRFLADDSPSSSLVTSEPVPDNPINYSKTDFNQPTIEQSNIGDHSIEPNYTTIPSIFEQEHNIPPTNSIFEYQEQPIQQDTIEHTPIVDNIVTPIQEQNLFPETSLSSSSNIFEQDSNVPPANNMFEHQEQPIQQDIIEHTPIVDNIITPIQEQNLFPETSLSSSSNIFEQDSNVPPANNMFEHQEQPIQQDIIEHTPIVDNIITPIQEQNLFPETSLSSSSNIFEQDSNIPPANNMFEHSEQPIQQDTIEHTPIVDNIITPIQEQSLFPETSLSSSSELLGNEIPTSEKKISEQTLVNEIVANNSVKDVNFFEYDFADETKNKLAPIETESKVADDLLHFDFDAVIREQGAQEKLPADNRIEIKKLFEPKENIIKKANEAKPEDNNVIHINEEDGNHFRRKKAFMKASLYAFYVFLVFFISIFAYTLYQEKTAFVLSRNEISLAINSTYQTEIIMNANVQDTNNYEWSSADSSVAEVSKDGIITAIKNGSTTITVKSKKTRKTKELLVNAISIIVDNIKFNKKNISMTVGDSSTLSPIINDDNTIIIDLIWESSNTNVVSVDSNGKITAVGSGTATIIAIEEISGLAAEIDVTVKAKSSTPNSNNNSNNNKVSVTGLSLNKSVASIKVGENITVNAIVRPANATNRKVSWSSSNSNIASVENGKITAKKAGSATITAKTNDGNKIATIKITVTESTPTNVSVTGVAINRSNISMEIGNQEIITATVSPNNATNKKVSWSSSNSNVATVDSNGKITAIGVGSTTITVTTEDGRKTSTISITVTEPTPPTITPTGVSLDKDDISLKIGENKSLKATVSPNNATNKNVNWSSSNSDIATVDSSGKVTAISEGVVTITVTTKEGNHTAKCTVTVAAKEEENL